MLGREDIFISIHSNIFCFHLFLRLNDIHLTNYKNTIIDIPKLLYNKYIYIRIDSNQVSDNNIFYDDDELIIQIKERYGKIKVISKTDHKPIKKAYIKVFTKNEFYKDGYTDIRGKFDYVSVSSRQLIDTQSFAILIVTEHCGSAVKYAKPPKM